MYINIKLEIGKWNLTFSSELKSKYLTTSRGKAKLRSHLALFILIANWQKNICDILLFFLSLETQKPWNLSFWYVSFQAYTELPWFRKFQDAENINVAIFELSGADIARKHTLIDLKTQFSIC